MPKAKSKIFSNMYNIMGIVALVLLLLVVITYMLFSQWAASLPYVPPEQSESQWGQFGAMMVLIFVLWIPLLVTSLGLSLAAIFQKKGRISGIVGMLGVVFVVIKGLFF